MFSNDIRKAIYLIDDNQYLLSTYITSLKDEYRRRLSSNKSNEEINSLPSYVHIKETKTTFLNNRKLLPQREERSSTLWGIFHGELMLRQDHREQNREKTISECDVEFRKHVQERETLCASHNQVLCEKNYSVFFSRRPLLQKKYF